MKVLHIVRQYAPAVGGLETFVRSLVSEQRKHGIDVEVLSLNRVFHSDGELLSEKEIIDGIPVQRIAFSGSHRYPLAWQVLKRVEQYDLLHVHGVDFFVDYLAATQFIHRKAIVLSTHGGFFHTTKNSRLKKLYFSSITRLALTRVARVYACSCNDMALFSSIKSSNVALFENGVDTGKFASSTPLAVSRRMIFVGRFSDNKRLDRLIAWFAELTKLHGDYHLDIVGKDWDGNQAKLSQQITHLALGQKLLIHTGLEDLQIKALMQQASFVVSASEYEGFGLTIVEGMSAGLVPIVSDIPSFRRIVEQAQLGKLCSFSSAADDIASIDSYINALVTAPQDLRQQAKDAASAYDWQKLAPRFSDSYQQVLGLEQRSIQGVMVDTGNAQQVIERLDKSFSQGKQTKLAFANAHTINLARNSAAFRDTLSQFLVLNDGIGVNIAARYKYGSGFAENLNGTDFTPQYLAQTSHQFKVFLLGSSDGVVSQCQSIWQQRYPQHRWVGCHNGFVKQEQTPALLEQIRQSGADVLIVGMGNPIQEQWIDEHAELLDIKLTMAVGALFDFTAGKVVRAPQWMRKFRCEWVFRLLQEPQRMWRRYLVGNARFLFACLKDSRP